MRRQWYLGIGAGIVAGAATFLFAPPIADASTFCITCGSDTIITDFKFSAVTSETEPAGTGHDLPGTLCGGGGSCDETTWAVGNITQVTDDGGSQILYNDGGANQIAFMIYGIGDISVSCSGTPTTCTILNTGSTNATQHPGADGKIHLDLYEYQGSLINFNTITPGDRTGFGTMTGVTTGAGSGETLYASFDLIPGVNPTDSSVTLQQTSAAATDPTTGTGTFYADCVGGIGCSEFDNAGDPGGTGILAALFGQFTLKPPIGFNSRTGTCNAGTNECNAGWDGTLNDPALAARAQVPEPASLGLLGTALAFLGLAIHRRRRGMSA